MKYAPYQELDTARLTLRKFRMADAPAFFRQLSGSEDVTKTMLWVTHREEAQAEESIRKVLHRYEAGGCYCWAITRKETQALIGRIDLLHFDEACGTCQFAYMLGADFWGKGYGTEALKAVLAFAFRELEVDAVQAEHFANNPASGAVMVKAGMTKIGYTPEKYEKDGSFHDAVHYQIKKEDWKSQ